MKSLVFRASSGHAVPGVFLVAGLCRPLRCVDWKQKLMPRNAAKSQSLNLARLTFSLARPSDVRPVGSGTKVFAGHGAFGFALNFDRQLRIAFPMPVSDLPQVANGGLAPSSKLALLCHRKAVQVREKCFHGNHFSRC
jgi:hypothetical protein